MGAEVMKKNVDLNMRVLLSVDLIDVVEIYSLREDVNFSIHRFIFYPNVKTGTTIKTGKVGKIRGIRIIKTTIKEVKDQEKIKEGEEGSKGRETKEK